MMIPALTEWYLPLTIIGVVIYFLTCLIIHLLKQNETYTKRMGYAVHSRDNYLGFICDTDFESINFWKDRLCLPLVYEFNLAKEMNGLLCYNSYDEKYFVLYHEEDVENWFEHNHYGYFLIKDFYTNTK